MRSINSTVFVVFLQLLLFVTCKDPEISRPADSPEVAVARLLVDEIDGFGTSIRLPNGEVRILTGSVAFSPVRAGELVLTTELLGCDQEELIVVSGMNTLQVTVTDTVENGVYSVLSAIYNFDNGGGAVENGTGFFTLAEPQSEYDSAYPMIATIVDRNDAVFSGTIVGRYHFTTPPNQSFVSLNDLTPYGEITIVFKYPAPFGCN